MRSIIFAFAILLSTIGQSQPLCRIKHYSVEDGISQNTIMNIHQDRQGNMWFATWDGLNKFDGYRFTTFKPRPGDDVNVPNSRFETIVEDYNGYLWILTYNKKVLRFNPRNHQFSNVPSASEKIKGFPDDISRIMIHTDNTIFLGSESGGIVVINYQSDNTSLTYKVYSSDGGYLMGNSIISLKEDKNKNTWALTNNGLVLFNQGQTEPLTYFHESASTQMPHRFSAFKEMDNEIWFGSINGEIWRYNKGTKNFNLIETNVSSQISDIKQANNQIIVGTSNDGIILLNEQGVVTKRINSATDQQLPGNEIQSIFIDSRGDAWIQQNFQGVTQLSSATNKITVHRTISEYNEISNLISQPVFSILEDKNGHLWIHPQGGGLSYYDRETGTLKYFYNAPDDPNRLFSNMIHYMYSDKQGNLWVCTRSKGLEKISFPNQYFNFHKPAGNTTATYVNDTRALLQDSNGRLWIATKDGKIHIYDKRLNYMGQFTQQGTIEKTGKPFETVQYTMLEDRDGNIWLGSKGNGIIKATPKSKGSLTFNLQHFTFDANNKYSLSSNNIYHLHQDSKGRIWIATYGGGLNYIETSATGEVRFINHRNQLSNYPIAEFQKARYVNSDWDNHLYIGTTTGLLTISDTNCKPEEMRIEQYQFQPNDSTCLSNNDVHYITTTRSHEIYIATFGGGLNKVIKEEGDTKLRFKSYNTSHGLPNDVLLAIQEDNTGKLWISSENGLAHFNPATEQFERYDEKLFGGNAVFSESSTIKDREGNIYFGTDKGFVHFQPDNIKRSSYVPSMVFTDLLLFNKKITPVEQSPILPVALDALDELTLTHKQNIVSIGFAALDYENPDIIEYAYMLEGFDKSWNEVGRQRMATYTNLPNGEYTMRVKSTNGDGVWVDNERQLRIKVLPSFWETPWAFLLYVIFLFLIVGLSGYILFVIYRLKSRVSMEHQLTELKLNFFTNISHELRTPLTLISGPVEHILETHPINQSTRDELKVVQSNTQRMLRMINQIMDFVKIQNKKMTLKVEEIEIAGFTRRIMDNFSTLANDHQIEFNMDDQSNNMKLFVDIDKYEKIVFNLLSNAFKFTPKGKTITVTIEPGNNQLTLKVKDSGIGISESKKKLLFQRFESFMDKNLFNLPSTGIGLSLVKELADMHHAQVEIESTEGEGTTIAVAFKTGINHFDKGTEIIIPDQIDKEINNTGDTDEQDDTEASTTSILIIEDNAELREFLHRILAPEFTVFQADNGTTGYKLAIDHTPDIIISDVMMPGLNGVELLNKLRQDILTSHIPVILLTAKTDITSKLEGLEKGADDYITKPFSTSYLMARIHNLLNQRQKLQELYRANMQTQGYEISLSQPEIQPQDQQFMTTLIEFMEKNIEKGNLVVEDMVSHMAMSRSVFFKKLKSITGLAPIEFIREIRVKRAAQFIESGEYNMTQISYMVGINDPRYFSKCFKQHFGMTPSEYKEHKEKVKG